MKGELWSLEVVCLTKSGLSDRLLYSTHSQQSFEQLPLSILNFLFDPLQDMEKDSASMY